MTSRGSSSNSPGATILDSRSQLSCEVSTLASSCPHQPSATVLLFAESDLRRGDGDADVSFDGQTDRPILIVVFVSRNPSARVAFTYSCVISDTFSSSLTAAVTVTGFDILFPCFLSICSTLHQPRYPTRHLTTLPLRCITSTRRLPPIDDQHPTTWLNHSRNPRGNSSLLKRRMC